MGRSDDKGFKKIVCISIYSRFSQIKFQIQQSKKSAHDYIQSAEQEEDEAETNLMAKYINSAPPKNELLLYLNSPIQNIKTKQ